MDLVYGNGLDSMQTIVLISNLGICEGEWKMQQDKRELHQRILVNLGVTLLWILGIILLGPPLFRFFLPLLVAWFIAMLANPLVSFLERRIKLMRKHGSMLVIALVLIMIASLLTLLVWWIVAEIRGWLVNLPELYQTVMVNLESALSSLSQRFHFLPDNLDNLWSEGKINDYILSALNSLKVDPIQKVGGLAGSIADGLVISVLTIMLSYFFVADRNRIVDALRKYMPDGVKSIWKTTQKVMVSAVGGYLKACFKIMLVMFAILSVFFIALRVDYSILIAFFTALLDFLPFIGTGTVLFPWALYHLLIGNYFRAIVLVIAYFVTLLVHRLLEPKLVGDSVGISPFLTLISMFIGYRMIGMLGLIIGIPAGMLIKALVEGGVFESQIRGIKILAEDIREFRKY